MVVKEMLNDYEIDPKDYYAEYWRIRAEQFVTDTLEYEDEQFIEIINRLRSKYET